MDAVIAMLSGNWIISYCCHVQNCVYFTFFQLTILFFQIICLLVELMNQPGDYYGYLSGGNAQMAHHLTGTNESCSRAGGLCSTSICNSKGFLVVVYFQ